MASSDDGGSDLSDPQGATSNGLSELGPPGAAASRMKAVDPEEMISKAAAHKEKGNELYKQKKYKGAIGQYHRALLYLKTLHKSGGPGAAGSAALAMQQVAALSGAEDTSTTSEQDAAIAELEANCYNNLAACLLQEPEVKYAKVSSYCAQVLERKPGNSKALYRYGLALYHSKDYDGALSKLHQALQQSPNDANVKRYIKLTQEGLARQVQRQRAMYKGMFDSSTPASGDAQVGTGASAGDRQEEDVVLTNADGKGRKAEEDKSITDSNGNNDADA
ncbi:PREDICTED: tetratricopeptide repeat protein 9C-like [Branchiostoma belcheri]|uniref:Tetratricopeptide repeat protein 9C-like n=1 Tax=Branchiostoma belcheri TaxID=7741 RepID=A0A6P4YEU9_BRABE|nr:PREDICTED: tetratricopeptide repeat protein 9C-like [Branchiostoma belcheri]XP_019615477.1 PREDICTED: tetratricopeptide repeat protein 9C-like [Branchiostoma belcheri]XP_019615478.1 PREDICTED: tetratricopeptide repeat protein 9C-like [Branchiostoma belcheri]